MSGHQLGMILVIKWFKNWHYEKNVFNKKRSPKLIFTNEKKKRRILSIFDIKNWTVIHWQIFFFSFEYVDS